MVFLEIYIMFRIIYNRFYRYRFLCALVTTGLITCWSWYQIRSFRRNIEVREEGTWKPWYTEVSCHTSTANDALPLLNHNATFPNKSIFFHVTSCKGGLSVRQACAVESAAYAHPGHQINVFFTSPVSQRTLDKGFHNTLLEYYSNVKFARVYIKSFAEKTPLELPIQNIPENLLRVHISKIMRYLTLYKYSGIYLGLDVVVARPLDDLWQNWAIREAPGLLSPDMFSFSQNRVGRKLAKIAVGYLHSELLINKEHDFWSFGGPSVVTYLLQNWCVTNKIPFMSLSTCEDLAVYGPELFYPVSFHERQTYFNGAADWNLWKDKKVFTYFLWERFTKYNIMSDQSLYGLIAKKYCPIMFHRYKKQFGVFSLHTENKTE